VQKSLAEFEAANVKLAVVSQSTAKSLATFHRWNAKPYPILGDPERRLYRAFGLERTRLVEFLKPRVLWRYLRLLFTGTKLRSVYGSEDMLQLGGDFLLAADGSILFGHASRESTDRPSVEQLLAAVRTHR